MEIYGFDIRTDIGSFGTQLKSWWRGGANGRAFRIYTTDPGQFNTLEGVDPGATLFNGAGGAKERQGPQSNLVLMPVSGFWTSLHPEAPPDPKLFQTFKGHGEARNILGGNLLRMFLRTRNGLYLPNNLFSPGK